MSGFPNANQGQAGFYGRPGSSSGTVNPLNTGLQLPTNAFNPSTTLPGPAAQSQHFGTPHLQQLTDFHQRQQAMIAQHQRQTGGSTPLQHIPPQLQQAVQQHQYRAAQQQVALQQLMQAQAANGSPRMQLTTQLPQTVQHPHPPPLVSQMQQIARPVQALQQTQQNFIPNLGVNRMQSVAPSTPTPQPQQARRPSVPVSQTFPPAAGSLPQPLPQQQIRTEAFNTSSIATPTFGGSDNPAPKPKKKPKKKKEDKVAFQPVYFVGIQPADREDTPAPEVHDERKEREEGAEGRKRGLEGMRGTMRNEISRLMYAAGDVEEPAMDSVDYMEDLVVEFIADLCRPVPPIRSNPQSTHQAVPITPAIVRHRLSHSSLRKYRDRFDYMIYMSSTLAEARRVDMPSNEDLVKAVGKEYLGLDASGADASAVKKRKGRPPKNMVKSGGLNGDGSEGAGAVLKERRKPGPMKGWKKDPEAVERARLKKEGKKLKDKPHGGGLKVET